jgi:hypothetical protein
LSWYLCLGLSLFLIAEGCGGQQNTAGKAANDCEVFESREPTGTRSDYSTEALAEFRQRIEALLQGNRPQGTVSVSVRSDLNKVLVELGNVDARLIPTICSQVPQDSVVFLKRDVIARIDDPRPKR